MNMNMGACMHLRAAIWLSELRNISKIAKIRSIPLKALRDMVHGSEELWRTAWDVHCETAPPKSLEGVSDRTTCQQRCAFTADSDRVMLVIGSRLHSVCTLSILRQATATDASRAGTCTCKSYPQLLCYGPCLQDAAARHHGLPAVQAAPASEDVNLGLWCAHLHQLFVQEPGVGGEALEQSSPLMRCSTCLSACMALVRRGH